MNDKTPIDEVDDLVLPSGGSRRIANNAEISRNINPDKPPTQNETGKNKDKE